MKSGRESGLYVLLWTDVAPGATHWSVFGFRIWTALSRLRFSVKYE